MSIVRLSVRATTIIAAAAVSAKKDVRYYLNGVHFQIRKGWLFVEATDGHSFIMTRDIGAGDDPDLIEYIDGATPDQVNFILPIHCVPKMTAAAAKKAGRILIEFNPASQEIKMEYADVKTACKAIDGRFPDMQRAATQIPGPNFTQDTSVQLDPEIVKRVSDAVRMVAVGAGGRSIVVPHLQMYRVSPTYFGGALIAHGDFNGAIGGVMGMKPFDVDMDARAKDLFF